MNTELIAKEIGGGYKHIISLGSFCSPALEIERLGLRDGSYPFDWVLSRSINNIVELISNGFSDLFNVDFFYQWKSQCSTYENIKCDIVFVHDFSQWRDLDSQLQQVMDKYQRRINRFYNAIQEKTLFVRYIESDSEYKYVEKNYDFILETLKSYNRENEILYIVNDDVCCQNNGLRNSIAVQKDADDSVARKFAEKKPQIAKILCAAYYSEEQRRSNLIFLREKKKKEWLKKLRKKLTEYIKKKKETPYLFERQI